MSLFFITVYINNCLLHYLFRVFWAVIVLLGASGSLYMGSLFWTRYINKPTLTRIETTYAPTSAIPFPAVTVCTSNRLSQTKIDKFITEL